MPHLREWLKDKDESPAHFGDRIGVDKSTVGRWIDESNPTLPSKEHMALIRTGTGGEVTACAMAAGYFRESSESAVSVEADQPL
jgi:hypothetical protein